MGDTCLKITREHSPTHDNEENEENNPITRRKRTKTRKRLMFASVTFVVSAVAVLSVAAIGLFSLLLMTSSRAGSQSKLGKAMTSEPVDQSEKRLHIEKREAAGHQGACHEDLCLTRECVHAASTLLSHMDETVDPCDNFFRYACGGWMERSEHHVSGDELFYSVVFSVLSENVDRELKELLRTGGAVPEDVLRSKPYEDLFLFYRRCNEVDHGSPDMTPVHEVLRELDAFQVGTPFDASSWDLTRALLQLFKINGAPLFDVMIDSDVKIAGKFAITITSPRHFGLFSRLKGRPPSLRRNPQGLQEYMTTKGRQVLFGARADDTETTKAMLGLQTRTKTKGKTRRKKRASLYRHTPLKAIQGRDSIGNLVVSPDLNEEEKEEEGEDEEEEEEEGIEMVTDEEEETVTGEEGTDDSSSSFPSSTSSSSSSSSSSFTTTPSPSPPISSSTTTSTTTTSRSIHSTASPTITSTTTTTITTTMGYEDDGEGSVEYDDYTTTTQPPVSRRMVYRMFKADMDVKRLETLATTLQDTFPNASAFVVPSAANHDCEPPEDVYGEVMTRFLPMLQKLQPTEREELEVSQNGELYNLVTITTLQQQCPMIDWGLLLGDLFDITITEETHIYVHFPQHLTRLCTIIDNTEPWVLHYALLTLYSHDVLQETVYTGEDTDRGSFCLEAVKSVFGEVMSNLYLHHIGNVTLRNIRESSSSIMEVLREEVEETIASATWLQQEDKETALHKLQKMGLEVGGLDKHWDISFVGKSHEEVNFPSNASFLHTVLELYRGFRQQLYQFYHKPLERDEFIWSYTVQPYIVDAFYAKDTNTIVFPEAFFNPPYYRPRSPLYLNYGSTATSMAHEIFHGFDLLGVLFDDQGLLSRPFSEEMQSHLQDTSDCYHNLLTQTFYEEMYIAGTLIAMEIDNTITKNENIADISGIRAAFRSYLRYERREGVEPRLPALPLTPHQLFFLSAAQPYCSVTSRIGNIFLMELDEHLPNMMRVNGMMKNLPEFTQAFNCSATSTMFANTTCQLF